MELQKILCENGQTNPIFYNFRNSGSASDTCMHMLNVQYLEPNSFIIIQESTLDGGVLSSSMIVRE